MADDGIQHHTEVRRERRPWVWIGLAALGLLLVPVLARSAGDGTGTAATPTAPTTTPSSVATSRPGPLAVLTVIADTDAGPRPATTDAAPDDAASGPLFEAERSTPVVTDGRVVVLVDDGTLLAGRPGEAFAPVGLRGSVSALLASNEPGHVWVAAPDDELALIDLDGADPPVRIPLGGDRILGPASFGVISVAADGAVSWRRPSFDPTAVPVPPRRTAIDAGGGSLLLERPLADEGGPRVFEVLAVVDGVLVGGFRGSSDRPAAIAPDGATVAIPERGGWTVRDSRSLQRRGALPGAASDPVWVGGDRWAVLSDGTAFVSDGTELSPPWRLRTLAEASP